MLSKKKRKAKQVEKWQILSMPIMTAPSMMSSWAWRAVYRESRRALAYVQRDQERLTPAPWSQQLRLKIWDLALDYGTRGTSAIQALFSTLTRQTCVWVSPLTTTYLEHFLLCHLPTNHPGMSKEEITGELKKGNPDINHIIRLFSPNHMFTLIYQHSNVVHILLFLLTSDPHRAYINLNSVKYYRIGYCSR